METQHQSFDSETNRKEHFGGPEQGLKSDYLVPVNLKNEYPRSPPHISLLNVCHADIGWIISKNNSNWIRIAARTSFICCGDVSLPVDDTVGWSRPGCSSEADVFEKRPRFISRTISPRSRRTSGTLGGGSFKSSVRLSCQKSVMISYKGQKSLIADRIKIQKRVV